jgi:8-oxo-dGTP diphosphatase
MTIPVFGKAPSIAWQERKAAYALISQGEYIGVVIGKNQKLFLPGGGIEPNEDPAAAVVREIWEESGRRARVVASLGEAIQFFTADGVHYRMSALYFECEFTSDVLQAGEHPFAWVKAAEVGAAFYHESHGWAVTQLQAKYT